MIKQLLAACLALCATLAMAAVDVNSATQADLDSIKGIGPGTTSKILAARKNGPFAGWPDLIERVSGIGASRATKLSAQGLTVNNKPFTQTKAQSQAPAKTKTAAQKPAVPDSTPAAATQ